jgi:hypothetical protein
MPVFLFVGLSVGKGQFRSNGKDLHETRSDGFLKACLFKSILMYECIYMYVRVYSIVHIHIGVYICTYVCVYVRMYVCMYVCIYEYM